MCLIFELLTEEPLRGCDIILFETFNELYTYLAVDCSTGEDEDTSDFIVPV
jgi:sortase (surface protein transpeptidase)